MLTTSVRVGRTSGQSARHVSDLVGLSDAATATMGGGDTPWPEALFLARDVDGLQGWYDLNVGCQGDEGDLEVYTGSPNISTPVHYEDTLFHWQNMGGSGLIMQDGGHFSAKNCKIVGRIDCEPGDRSVYLENCTVDGDEDVLGVGYFNVALKRCDVYNALQCVNIGGDMLIDESHVHHPYLPNPSEDHVNPIFLAGPRVTIRRSLMWAPIPDTPQGGGVTTNLTMLTVGGPIHDVTVEQSLVRWTYGGYGASFSWNPERPYNDHPDHGVNIKTHDMIFERGPSGHNAVFGPVTSCPIHRPGFEWENVVYDDGTPIEPSY